MLKALEITLKNKALIAEANNGLVPYNDKTIKTLLGKTFFIATDEGQSNLVVPARSFKRRFKFQEAEVPNHFAEVIRK